MPVAYFDVHVANTTRRPDTVSVMFTFPNAPAHVPNTGSYWWIGGGRIPTSRVGSQTSTRTGLTSSYRVDPSLGAGGLTLGADSSSNTVDTQGSDWTIAAMPRRGQQESYTTSWNGSGSGSDVVESLQKGGGSLSDKPLDSTNSAGAIAVRVHLRPGESTTIPFVLAWDFPHDVYTSGSGPSATDTVWMRRYTEWFGARMDAQNDYVPGSYHPHQGWNIAKWALRNRHVNLRGVERWWAPIAQNPRVPIPVRTSALNQLYYLTAGDSMWVNGLVSNTVTATDGARLGAAVPGTHLFSQYTGEDGGDNSFGCGSPFAVFDLWDRMFPNIERDCLRAATEATMRDGPGVAGIFGSGTGSPFVQWSPGGGIGSDWAYVYGVWRYYQTTHDAALLRYAYPAMLDLYRHDQTIFHVQGSEGALPTGGGRGPGGAPPGGVGTTTHDLLQVSGFGIEAAGNWMLEVDAMRAATQAARRLGIAEATDAVGDELSARFAATKATLNSQLWNTTARHFNFDTGNGNANSGNYDQGLFADAAYPEDATSLAGLPSIFDTRKIAQHLQQVYDHNVAPFRSNGQLIGAVDLLSANNGVIGDVHPTFLNSDANAREMWVGEEYPLAAAMINVGRDTGNRLLVSEGINLANAVANGTWNTPANGYAFQTPEAQGLVLASAGTTDGNAPVPAAQATAHPELHRNLSYVRPLNVWDLYDTFVPLNRSTGAYHH